MIKNFNKTFFLIVCIIFYSKFAFSKSPPPGTGTADVPANILIMLDNSGSMSWDVNGNERYANSSYVNRPYDVVRDDNGDIYVFSLNTRKITVLDDDGSFKRELLGYGPGRCDKAYYGFKFDIYGDNIYFLDSYDRKIKVINKNTGSCVNSVNTWERRYGYNQSITVNENYIFVGTYNSGINVYDRSSLRYIRTFTNSLWFDLHDIAVNKSNNKIAIAVTGYGLVCEHSLSGSLVGSTCSQVGFDRSTTDIYNQRYNYSNGYHYRPEGVDYDVNGNIYTIDRGTYKLQKFDSNGNFLKVYGSYNNPWRLPYGLNVGNNNKVYIAGYLNNRIYEFNNPVGGNLSLSNTLVGTSPSRLDIAKKVIKRIVSNSELTDGANFGLMEWGHPYRWIRSYSMMNNPYQGWRYNWYGTRMLVRITPTGAQQIYNVIDNVKAGGGTYLLNAMNLARQEFAGPYSPIIKGADCQQNFLIVISDGDWSQASSVNSIASQMARQNPSIKTFAVGFATGGNKPNYTNLASAGGTVTPLFAENEDELFAKLTEAIKQITGSTLTFTAPAISTDARSNDYIYQSTFTYSKNNQWKGFLKKYQLNSNGSFGNMIWDAGTLLNNKLATSRQIWTVGAGNVNLNNVTTSNLSILKNKFFTTTATDSEATKLINFIRGLDSYDEDGDGNTNESRHKLGDIYHSNINIVGKPSATVQYTNEFQTGFYRSQNGYSNFMAKHLGRRETIYVGANDGMLHAFDAITGNELWAFIPPSLHTKLSTMISSKANSTNSIYGVDGSSSVKDIYINGEWKTVLISGLGAGGHSFFALDITDPNNPKHLFTINNDSSNGLITFWDKNGDDQIFAHDSSMLIENDYRKLGETWSAPRIVKLKINNVDKWVAIAGGGYNGATNPNYGSAVFIIDLENDGKLINKIDIEDKTSIDIVNSIPSDLTIITADSTENAKYYGALVYAFDLEGKITKINLTDKGTLYDQTQIFDTESNTTNGRFLYKKASATIIDDNLWFYFGTGNTQKLQDKSANTLNRLYGIKDKYFPIFNSVSSIPTVRQCKTAPNCPNSADTGWYVDLKNGQKLSDEPTIDNDRVYFPIYEPTEGANVCKTGKAILSSYSSKCGNSLLNINLGAGVLTKVVKNDDNLYVGISGDAGTAGTGFIDKDNLLTGKSQSKTTGGKIQLEGWKENY